MLKCKCVNIVNYELKNVIKVGHYAIRITWGDGHSDGIFTHEYLRKLDLSSE